MVVFLTERYAHVMCTVAFRETPNAGSYTYKLNISGSGITSAKRFLSVKEVKK